MTEMLNPYRMHRPRQAAFAILKYARYRTAIQLDPNSAPTHTPYTKQSEQSHPIKPRDSNTDVSDMTSKPNELDNAICLAELPYYDHTVIPMRTKPPLYKRGASLPLITPTQRELPPYHAWSEIADREWPKHNPNKYYNPKLFTRWNQYRNQYKWNCNQRGYEYRKPKQILLGKDKPPQPPKERRSQATEAKPHGCPKQPSYYPPKAPEEDDTPPSWFLKWRKTNMIPQEDVDTAPTWFTDYMDYTLDDDEPPIWFTRHVNFTSESPPKWFTEYMEDHKLSILNPLTKRTKESHKQIKILRMENSATSRSLDRINLTLKELWKYPVFLKKRGEENASGGLMIPEDKLLNSDEELTFSATEID